MELVSQIVEIQKHNSKEEIEHKLSIAIQKMVSIFSIKSRISLDNLTMPILGNSYNDIPQVEKFIILEENLEDILYITENNYELGTILENSIPKVHLDVAQYKLIQGILQDYESFEIELIYSVTLVKSGFCMRNIFLFDN